MRVPLLLAALLFSAPPSLAANDMEEARLKGYNYGYIYGVGNTLCALVIDKLIKKEYAQSLLSGTVEALSKDPSHKDYAAEMRNAYRDLTEDVACKTVYQ